MTKNFKDLIFKTSFINGQWQATQTSTFDVLNPADRSIIASVNDDGVPGIEQAIDSASKAQARWQAQAAKERSQILESWFDLVQDHKEELAHIISLESGKPIKESLGEVAYGSAFIKFYAEEAKRVDGDILPANSNKQRIAVIKQAIGVVGAITPWNFPLAMITRKVSPALAAGCTLVIRPSEDTPLTALALAELARKAGFPAGVFNVVVGKDPAAMGLKLCQSPQVQKISFTGSTRVGRLLMAQSSETLKRLSLELGGNAPFIVFEDADLELAVQGAMASKFRNSGQTCVCVNRFIVHENIHDDFVKRFKAAMQKLKVGPGTDESCDIGPLIHQNAALKAQSLLQNAYDQGGKILLGEENLKSDFKDSTYFQPSLIVNASKQMKLAQEEIFGPVAAVFKFKEDHEAIQMANDTIYGLASYFYSKDISRCWKVSEALEYGMVGINEGIISTEVAPFGGIKASGFGREGSKYGIEDYLNIKYLCFGNV